jgi:FixJ family two-component response regulator
MVAPATPNPFEQHHQSGELERSEPGLASAIDRALTGLRLLVVDPDPAVAALLRDALGATEARVPARRPSQRSRQGPALTSQASGGGIRLYRASSLAEAGRVLKRLAARGEAVHLLIAEEHLPDGDGAQLAQALSETESAARMILISATPSLEASIDAFRRGALDYLAKPLTGQSFAQRLKVAAGRQFLQLKERRRMGRLKRAVRQLNEARRTVGKKVDLLCQDLVTAYSDLARQVERIRVGGHLAKLLESAGDLEQLLCHMMDWILREMGHCNIAIYLTDEEGKSELGAYMKHTIAGDDRVTRWLKTYIVPRATAQGYLNSGDAPAGPVSPDLKPLQQQSMVAVQCTYLAESLATIVVFRKREKPLGGDDRSLLEAAGPVFATALTNLIRRGESEQKKLPDEDEWWRRSA